ncbi:MAG TPA: hypothetical protein VE244_13355 [Nitrososphaeraceae archaeon]|nr:hypothetical protein [Nitrososphaeraceae archaeon]
MSKEQSWVGPQLPSTGHSPGQSICLPRLQKNVKFKYYSNRDKAI